MNAPDLHTTDTMQAPCEKLHGTCPQSADKLKAARTRLASAKDRFSI